MIELLTLRLLGYLVCGLTRIGNLRDMKNIFLALLLIPGIRPLMVGLQAQALNPNLDTMLVKKWGADQYGMRTYIFILLKTGSADCSDKERVSALFAGHMRNIDSLSTAGKLIVAGPFMKNEADLRGLFILNCSTLEEAEAMLMTDPAIHAGLLKAECYVWYGSAAIPAYLEIHDKLWREQP